MADVDNKHTLHIFDFRYSFLFQQKYLHAWAEAKGIKQHSVNLALDEFEEASKDKIDYFIADLAGNPKIGGFYCESQLNSPCKGEPAAESNPQFVFRNKEQERRIFLPKFATLICELSSGLGNAIAQKEGRDDGKELGDELACIASMFLRKNSTVKPHYIKELFANRNHLPELIRIYERNPLVRPIAWKFRVKPGVAFLVVDALRKRTDNGHGCDVCDYYRVAKQISNNWRRPSLHILTDTGLIHRLHTSSFTNEFTLVYITTEPRNRPSFDFLCRLREHRIEISKDRVKDYAEIEEFANNLKRRQPAVSDKEFDSLLRASQRKVDTLVGACNFISAGLTVYSVLQIIHKAEFSEVESFIQFSSSPAHLIEFSRLLHRGTGKDFLLEILNRGYVLGDREFDFCLRLQSRKSFRDVSAISILELFEKENGDMERAAMRLIGKLPGATELTVQEVCAQTSYAKHGLNDREQEIIGKIASALSIPKPRRIVNAFYNHANAKPSENGDERIISHARQKYPEIFEKICAKLKRPEEPELPPMEELMQQIHAAAKEQEARLPPAQTEKLISMADLPKNARVGQLDLVLRYLGFEPRGTRGSHTYYVPVNVGGGKGRGFPVILVERNGVFMPAGGFAESLRFYGITSA
ncbi:Uncharacterised protein [Candidatus Gugararchaeum adminiculabundum]|nr:Uncharacterised protein [Candidatus Gugararchaeum adminiculabundum]